MYAHDLSHEQPPAALPLDHGLATVTAKLDAHRWRLETGARSFEARRATSCVVDPVVGDRVWHLEDGQRSFILAVLERTQGASVTLRADGDLRVESNNGRVSIHAGEGIELSSEAELGLTGEALRVQASSVRLIFEALRVAGRSVFASVDRVTRIGRVLELFVERITQRSQQVQRSVAGLDFTEAGTILQRAESSAQIHGEHAMLTGKQLVKLDGQQVHLG